jgi:hypothetical protein
MFAIPINITIKAKIIILPNHYLPIITTQLRTFIIIIINKFIMNTISIII